MNTTSKPSPGVMLRALRAVSDSARVPVLQRFFRTRPGEYGEGDRFIGVTVPAVRTLCRQFKGASLDSIDTLLQSPIHEARLLALFLLCQSFRTANDQGQRRIFKLYLARTHFINSWDLVDTSAPHIVGAWLAERNRAPLQRLARSTRLWDRRIAIIATLYFIRRLHEVRQTFALADVLLNDPHDLIHKAVGWMLREAADQDPAAVRKFLATRHTRMPRTMLRYAIEKYPEQERRRYLIAGRTSRKR